MSKLMSRSAMKPVEVLSEDGQDTSAITPQKAAPQPQRGPEQGAHSQLRGPRVTAEKPAEAAPTARAADAVPDTDSPQTATRSAGRKKIVFGIIGVLALAGAIGFGVHWWTVGRFMVSTDDAYVGADIAQLSARVAARVDSVPVAANQHVHKGDVLVRLDDTDFRLAVDQAQAKLATQEASITRFSRQIEAAKAAVTQARAQLDSANAESERAEADFKRIQALAKSQYNSVASLDTARANRDKARAAVEAAKAGITSAEANISVLEAQKIEAERTAGELRVAVAKAEWDLDSTVVRAPIDGFVGNKSVQVGDYTTAGKRLAAVVPDEAVYIDANFKETQLAGIRPGAHVAVSVDAAGGQAIDGTVMSIAPATGSQFSLLPPENATGNFTKIVQRVPVRISVPKEAVERGFLRPGLSVVATVDVRTGAANAPAAAPNQPDQPDQPVHASSLQGAER